MAKTTSSKLLIKPGSAVWLSDPARGGLIDLPDGAHRVDTIAPGSIAVMFAESEARLRDTLDAERARLTTPAVLWIAYPKGNRADVNRDKLWPILAEYGLRPVSQVAIDEEWSALRFRPLEQGEQHVAVASE